jgi:hypothetical protein
MMISFGLALESPLLTNMPEISKNVVLLIGLIGTGIWVIQCLAELIKMCIAGAFFKEADDIIGAYMIILGFP